MGGHVMGGWVGEYLQLGKNSIKGATQVNGHSLKLLW